MLPAEKLGPAATTLREQARARGRLEAERAAAATYFILDLGRSADEREFVRGAEAFMTRVAH